MSKLIGISTGLKDVEMAPGNISCVVINNDFVKACNIFGNNAVIFGPHENSNTVDVSKFDAIIPVEKITKAVYGVNLPF